MEHHEQVEHSNFPRHENVERIFRLLQLLLANECTRQDVFVHLADYYRIKYLPSDFATEKIATSRSADKLFERDLHFLAEQGFRVKKMRKRNQPVRYRLEKGSGPQTVFLFTPQEVDCLALLYNMFADPSHFAAHDASIPLPQRTVTSPFTQDILALIDKLAATLPPEQRLQYKRWTQKPYLYFDIATVGDYLPCRAMIDTIIRAISHRQQIAFHYQPAKEQQSFVPHEEIDPYYIIYMEGHFYLIAYSHKVSALLEYRIDRIKEDTLKELPTMIDVARRRQPIVFHFWLDAGLAQPELSQRWLTQTIEREETTDKLGRERKRVLVRATAYSEWRIIQQMLRYGERAELVDPPRLRTRMRQVVQQMSSLYED